MSIRPVFRVASAGLDPRDVRLIEIVFQHSQYNRYDFRMTDGLDPDRADILIANPSDTAGLDALAAVGSFQRPIPSISAVPRGTQATARYSITIDRLTLQLLPTLNRVVEMEKLEPAAAPDSAVLCEELTEIHLDAPDGPPAAHEPARSGPVRPEPERSRPEPMPAEPVAASAVEPAGRPVRTQVSAAMTPASASRAAAHAIAHAADRAAAAPVRIAQATAPQPLRLQVLVADPSSAAQQQLARALRRLGLEVHCVDSAAAAMQCLGACHVDLVITESGLADSDGFDLIRRMRSQIPYRYTPVLLLRSRLHLFDSTRARLAGDVSVLAKPLTRHELESVVRRTLRNSVILDDLNELLAPA